MNFRLSTTFVHINFSSIERKKNCHRFYIAWEMKSEFLSLQFHLAKIIVDDVALCSIVLQKKAFSFSSSFLLLGQECCRVNSHSEGKVRKIKIELETERRGWKKRNA